MKKLKETIKVKSNKSKRTFTISKYIDGKLFAKYRTIQMSRAEFESEENNTEADWIYFLRTNFDYYKI